MALENGEKKGGDLKEKLAYELTYLWERIKENVVDAAGIGWIFDKGLSKLWDVVVFLVITYIRWWIKIAIFIAFLYCLGWVMFPHSMGKLW